MISIGVLVPNDHCAVVTIPARAAAAACRQVSSPSQPKCSGLRGNATAEANRSPVPARRSTSCARALPWGRATSSRSQPIAAARPARPATPNRLLPGQIHQVVQHEAQQAAVAGPGQGPGEPAERALGDPFSPGCGGTAWDCPRFLRQDAAKIGTVPFSLHCGPISRGTLHGDALEDFCDDGFRRDRVRPAPRSSAAADGARAATATARTSPAQPVPARDKAPALSAQDQVLAGRAGRHQPTYSAWLVSAAGCLGRGGRTSRDIGGLLAGVDAARPPAWPGSLPREHGVTPWPCCWCGRRLDPLRAERIADRSRNRKRSTGPGEAIRAFLVLGFCVAITRNGSASFVGLAPRSRDAPAWPPAGRPGSWAACG